MLIGFDIGMYVVQLLGQLLYKPKGWWFASQLPLITGHVTKVSLDKTLNP